MAVRGQPAQQAFPIELLRESCSFFALLARKRLLRRLVGRIIWCSK